MSTNAVGEGSLVAGLTSQEAEARLGRFGPNEPTATHHRSVISDLWHAFTN